MPRKTKPSLNWRGNRWSPRTSRAIEARASRLREPLATLLELTEPSEIDALVTKIKTTLILCWAYLRDVDHAASSAKVYRTLEYLSSLEASELVKQLWDIDPNAREAIAQRYGEPVDFEGGDVDPTKLKIVCAFEGGDVDPTKLKTACDKALHALPAPPPGRPKDTASTCREVLAKGLADAFHNPTGRTPGRTVKGEVIEGTSNEGNYEYAEVYTETGRFLEFVQLVIDSIPRRFRPSPEETARLGASLFKKEHGL